MFPRTSVAVAVVALCIIPLSATAQSAGGGPELDLPPPPTATKMAVTTGDGLGGSDPMRGMQAERFRRARLSTTIGGYAEMHVNHKRPEGAKATTDIDMHRLVLFVAHQFAQDVRFYTELEVEHAFVHGEAAGEVGVEQGFVDWRLLGDSLGVRVGIVLVPMGVTNQWHEPPIFHGVERPNVDKVIIPSTWREGGIGIFGEPMDGLRYELYLIGGLHPMGFSASGGIRGGRQLVANARMDALALTGRVEYEPMLGLVVGGSTYLSDAGPNLREAFTVTGTDGQGEDIVSATELELPIVGLSADARLRHKGLEAKAVIASFSIGNTEKLREITDKDGHPVGPDIGSQILGWYGEVGYDLLRHLGTTEQQLLPFFRYERYDTTFATEAGSKAGIRGATDMVFGLSYRPVSQFVFKGNVILRTPDNNRSQTLLDLGFGCMF